ncbi:MAG: COG4315 family predicted lipoprotein [Nocardioidaceae bacterium]
MNDSKTTARALAAGVGVLVLAAACGSSNGTNATSPPSAVTSLPAGVAVGVSTTPVGKLLVTSSGRTMYAFAADSKGHSNCTATCLQYWPPVPASAAPKGSSAVSATLGEIKGTSGAEQLTVNGWPMYTYSGDSKAGDTNGQGLNLSGGLWWVVAPSGSWIKSSAGTSGGGGYAGGGGGGY